MAHMGAVTVTVNLDAATAALVAIRGDAFATLADPRGDASASSVLDAYANALRRIRDTAAAALKKAEAQPRIRHA
jgi:hypothetical protein